MGRRYFGVEDIVEVFVRWQAGSGIKRISRSLGLDRNTVRKYIRAALEAGYRQGVQVSEEEWSNFAREVLPSLASGKRKRPAFEEIARYHDEIKEFLSETNIATSWQRLKESRNLGASRATFWRYVHCTMPELVKMNGITLWRPEVSPGEEAQVDFCYLGFWVDPATGRRRKIFGFTMVLSYSRHMYLEVVTKLDRLTWCNCNVRAFTFFEGSPKRIVIDNAKTGVLKPDIYDPKLNRSYAELKRHYGFIVDPCRSGRPKDKPRVERTIRYVKESFWAGRRFSSIAEMNEEAMRWCLEVAGNRMHGTTRRRPLELFEEERGFLNPLPRAPWESVFWTRAKVAPDCCVQVQRRFYSVPFIHVGKEVDVRVTSKLVQIFHDGEIIKTHVRTGAIRQTDWSDYPPEKAAFYRKDPQWCLRQASKMGPGVFEAVLSLISQHALHHLRQAQGIIGLGERYGSTRLNAACERAARYGEVRYRTIKMILEKGLDRMAFVPHVDVSTVPGFLRGPEEILGKLMESENAREGGLPDNEVARSGIEAEEA